MKTKLIIGFICVFAILSSCNNDDDGSDPITLHTSWTLKQVSGGLVGADDAFEYGLIKWHFNEGTSILTVENFNTDDTLYDILESGTYTYSISTIDNIDFLMVDGSAIGRIDLSLNELILDQNLTVDGFLIGFERYVALII